MASRTRLLVCMFLRSDRQYFEMKRYKLFVSPHILQLPCTLRNCKVRSQFPCVIIVLVSDKMAVSSYYDDIHTYILRMLATLCHVPKLTFLCVWHVKFLKHRSTLHFYVHILHIKYVCMYVCMLKQPKRLHLYACVAYVCTYVKTY